MRAIWTGAIGFGLVNIPVKLFSATQGSELDLDMLDKKDYSNIRFQRINENTGKVVAWENIVRGYKYNGKYVVLTDEDFKKASPEKTKTITINEFVDVTEIDVVYFETPYFLQPEKSGERAYALLREALQKSGKVGLGSYVLRNRENLCLLKPQDKAIILEKIRFPQEIRDPGELDLPAASSVKPAELKMALALIDQLSGPFDVSKYQDTYSDELMKLIKAKAKGKKLPEPQLRVVHSKTKDIMSQLKASLDTKKKKAS